MKIISAIVSLILSVSLFFGGMALKSRNNDVAEENGSENSWIKGVLKDSSFTSWNVGNSRIEGIAR